MAKVRFTFIIALAILISAGTTALFGVQAEGQDAGSVADSDTRVQGEISDLEVRLDALKARIMNIQEGDDPVLLVEEYLSDALHVVYFARALASNSNETATRTHDLVSLVEAGYLSAWPENPVNNWEPMRVLSPASGFSAGDLCIDYCPSDYYSDVGGGPEPISFQLYVYGITPDQGQFQDVHVLGWNKRWAQVPLDVLYGLSLSASPANEPKYRYNPETGEVYEVK